MQKIQAKEHKKCCPSSKVQIQASGSHIQKQNLSADQKKRNCLWNWEEETTKKEKKRRVFLLKEGSTSTSTTSSKYSQQQLQWLLRQVSKDRRGSQIPVAVAVGMQFHSEPKEEAHPNLA